MRQRYFRSSLLGLMALLALVFSLALVGCDDDGDDGEEATPQDLEGRTFTFNNGGFFDIPEGTPFTLTFFDFGGDETALFTVATAASTAGGTATVDGGCDFMFDSSNFPLGTGPQPDDEFEADCLLEDGVLILDDDVTGSTGG